MAPTTNSSFNSRPPVIVFIVVILIVIAVLIAVWLRQAGVKVLPGQGGTDSVQLTEEEKAQLLNGVSDSSNSATALSEDDKKQLLEGVNQNTGANTLTEEEKTNLLKGVQ